MPLEGGEAEQITAMPHGVSAFRHAPQGRRLALAAAAPEPRFLVGPPASGGLTPLARVIARVDWRRDGQGFLDRHTHLWVQEARPGARPKRLTRGDWSVEGFCWSPDAKRIAFCAERDEGRPISSRRRPCTSCRRRAASRASSRASRARAASVCWSPDGEHVAFLGINEAGEPFGCEDSLWVVPSGGGEPRDLAPVRHLVMHLHLTRPGDLLDWEDGCWQRPRLGRLRGGHLPAHAWPGTASLWRFPLEGEPEQVEGCEPHIHGYAHGGGRIVTFRAVDGGRAELYAEHAQDGPRRLTRDGAAWQRAAGRHHLRETWRFPGQMAPIRATLVSTSRRGPQAAAARALDHRRAGVELGARAVAARPGAGRRGCARPAARPARLGELWPRLAGGDPRRLGRRGRRGSTGVRRLGGAAGNCRSGAPGRHGPFLRRIHDALADRSERSLPRRRGRQRREQPDLLRRQLRPGRPLDAAPRLGPPPTDSGASGGNPAGPRRGNHDALADAPGRGGPPLPGGRQRAALRGPASARPYRRVRALPGRGAPDAGDRTPGPPDRHARAAGATALVFAGGSRRRTQASRSDVPFILCRTQADDRG